MIARLGLRLRLWLGLEMGVGILISDGVCTDNRICISVLSVPRTGISVNKPGSA